MSRDWSKRATLAPDWLHESEQPIRSQNSKLTQLLTMTATHKFPLQLVEKHRAGDDFAGDQQPAVQAAGGEALTGQSRYF